MPGPTELIIIAVIVMLLFGTSKLKSMGGDLGSMIKGFRSAMDDDKQDKQTTQQPKADEARPIPGTTETKQAESVDSKNGKDA